MWATRSSTSGPQCERSCFINHEERPHQGLGNELIAPKTPVIRTGQIKCRERLGGLLKFYDREAA
jgi:hypothetical protein